MNNAVAKITELLEGRTPKTALVLGSGLGGLVDEVKDAVRISYADLPGFPHSGVTGHAGQLVTGARRHAGPDGDLALTRIRGRPYRCGNQQ